VDKVPARVKVEGDFWPQDGLVLEHIADKPMRFARRKDLKEYCKEHGLSSGALL
jgi:hypothetical protein